MFEDSYTISAWAFSVIVTKENKRVSILFISAFIKRFNSMYYFNYMYSFEKNVTIVSCIDIDVFLENAEFSVESEAVLDYLRLCLHLIIDPLDVIFVIYDNK